MIMTQEKLKKLVSLMVERKILMLKESDAFAKVKVEDIMTKDVNTVKGSLTVSDLLILMAKQHHIGPIHQISHCGNIVTYEQE
jgi:CBS domain-containing protein